MRTSADRPTPAIEFMGVEKRFAARGQSAEVLAARDVSFSIATGEVVSIIGPSGCGKSTLLNMGAGLSKPSRGTVKVSGEAVTGPNRHVAFMLQKDLLMPWRTIAQNVDLALSCAASPPQSAGRFQSVCWSSATLRVLAATTPISFQAACASVPLWREHWRWTRWSC